MNCDNDDDDDDDDVYTESGGVFLTSALDQNTLLLPTLTDSGRPALTLTSAHLVHSCLTLTRKNYVISIYSYTHPDRQW